VAFAFVIAARVVLTLVAETTAEGVLHHAWSHTREVLVHGVAGNVRQLYSILFPF